MARDVRVNSTADGVLVYDRYGNGDVFVPESQVEHLIEELENTEHGS